MAKIYVSSTFNDLEECRRQVSLVIRKMGHQDVAMEYYIAEDKRPIDKCLQDVANCDLYIGIFAWRYGWVPKIKNPNKLSITELEYRQAIKKKKTCLIFLLDDKALWPPAFIDDNKKRMKRLRDELSEKHGAALFTSADNIGSVVAPAIHEWMKKSGLLVAGEPVTQLHLDEYYNALRKRYGVLALEGLTPPQKEEYLQIQLRQVFIEQNVRKNPPPLELPKELLEMLRGRREIHKDDLPQSVGADDLQATEIYYKESPVPVLDVLIDPNYQHTIILGDPGSGKSTLARYVMLSLIDSTGDDKLRLAFEGYLPLLIELRTYIGACAEGNCNSFLEFLEYLGKTEGWALAQSALHNHLKNDGQAIVIFDGLDEIFDPEKRETITRQIVGFCNDYRKVRIIVTSRVIGYRRKILTDAGFIHFTLQDLDEKQVETFVSRWYNLAMGDRPDEAKERRERILRSFKESASIRQLAGNPILLTIMAIIGKHQELPRERWKLFDHAASVLIQHWDVNKHLKNKSIDADFIGEDDKKELLRRLAFRMQGGDGGLAGNYIHREQLQAEFESYLTERYRQTPDRAVTIARAMIEQFHERNFILSLYGANLYGFVHRAFLEYFCASAFVYKFEKTKELTIEHLKSDVYGKHWQERNWHEVLRLICGMIDEQWVEEIMQYLLDLNNNMSWNVALAVQILGEVRNLNLIAPVAKMLLERICKSFDHYLSTGDSIVYDLMQTQIISTVSVVGPNWPHRFLVVDWVKRLKAVGISYSSADLISRFISSLIKEKDDIFKSISGYLDHPNEGYRVLALLTLSRSQPSDSKVLEILMNIKNTNTDKWIQRAVFESLINCSLTNSQALQILRQLATSANISERRIALSALIEHHRSDSQTLLLVYDRTVNEVESDLRRDALSALVEYYRDNPRTLTLLQDRAVNEMKSDLRKVALSALIEHYRDDPKTLALLQERAVNEMESYLRKDALSALVEHYRGDPNTLVLLHDRVVNETEGDLRKAALSALVEYFRDDPETLLLLHEHAVKDADKLVRHNAIDALAQSYRDNPETLQLLREWAAKSKHADVRISADNALARYYHDNPKILPLLRKHAIKDGDQLVRHGAIYAIAQYYYDNPETLSLLHEWTANEMESDLRQVALSALAKYYRDDPETLLLLREHALKDADEYTRCAAIDALVQYYRDNPEILSLLHELAFEDANEDVRHTAKRALGRHDRDLHS